MNRRELLIAVALTIPVTWFVLGLRSWWFVDVVQGQSFGSTPAWFSPAHVTYWAFEFAWSSVLGLVVAGLAKRQSGIFIAGTCGALEGLFHFLMSSHIFYPSAHWSLYFWAYGIFVVPLVGAITGAILVVGIANRSAQRAV